jgi:hypothetical protein
MTSHAGVHFCSICQDEAVFDQPECVDGHGPDCPEWVCVQCGDAFLVGFALVEPPRVLGDTSNVA